MIGVVVDKTPKAEGCLPKHLVVRESSKRLVSGECMPLPEHQDDMMRTIGRADFIILNESIVHEGLNNLLYRLGNCEAVSPRLSDHGPLAPMPFIFGPNFSSSLSLNGNQ